MHSRIFDLSCLTFFIFGLLGCGNPQIEHPKSKPVPNQVIENQVVEVTCGLCKFGLHANECHIAIKLGEGTCFVDGVDAGDPAKMHEPDGYCVAIRKAKVSGEVINNRFKAKSFELLPK